MSSGMSQGMSPGRVLFAFAGGVGHLNPLLPLAALLRERGHVVGVSGRASAIASTALFATADTFPVGEETPPDEEISELLAPDLAHELAVVGRFFAGTSAERTATRVLDVIERWRPDLVIADEMDFGAVVAAERAGLPVVVVSVIASGGLTRPEHVRAPLEVLRRAHGLPPDPALHRTYGDLLVHPFPSSLRDPAFPLPVDAVLVRPEDPPGEETEAARWLLGGRPRTYLTLGTIFNAESGDLFGRLLAGLAGLPGRVLVTVGPSLDPARFGEQPAHVRLERYVAQSRVLPHCDVVVNHGGSGSVVGALTHGVPLIVVPMGADQELNARRVSALGAGVVLDPMTADGEQLRAAVEALLAPDSPQRAAAAQVRDEIAGLPTMASVVPQVEALLP